MYKCPRGIEVHKGGQAGELVDGSAAMYGMDAHGQEDDGEQELVVVIRLKKMYVPQLRSLSLEQK